MFSSFSSRNARLFFAGQVVSQGGSYMGMLAHTLLVLSLTGSGTAVGSFTACQFLPVLLFGAWAGLIVDRSDKRRLLIGVQAFAMVQSFALAGLAFMSQPPIILVFVLGFTSGLAAAFDNPARRSFVVELVPHSLVQNAAALNSALMTSARIVGPAIAGVLIATSGYGWCFLLDGLSCIAVFVTLWRIDTAQVRRSVPVERAKGQVRAGLNYVRAVPALRVSLVMIAIVGMLTMNYNVVLPLLVTRTLHGSTSQFSILYALMSLGAVIGALVIARREAVKLRHVTICAIACGAAMTMVALVPNLAVAYPVVVLLGASSTAFNTAGTALVHLRAEPMMRGRVLALQTILLLGSTPIGGPVVGVVCDAFGARSGVVVGAAAALGAGSWGALMRRRLSAVQARKRRRA